MSKYIFLLTLLLTACAGDYQAKAMQGTPQAVKVANTQAVGTPTPDIISMQNELILARQQGQDALDTARAKQLEIDEYNRQGVVWTAQAEAALLAIIQITQAAQINILTADANSIIATQGAAVITQTALPIIATVQKQNSIDRAAELQAQAAEPERIRNLTDAEQDAKWADEREVAAMCLKFVLFIIGIVAIIRLFIGGLYKLNLIAKMNDEKAVPDSKLSDLLPIPPAPVDNTIRCSNEQLVLFAEGIENENKTLAFRQWETTPVYNRLKSIREFMTRKQADGKIFAIPAGSFGELQLTEAGRGFLNMVLVLKTSPYPYTCEDETTTSPQSEDAHKAPPQPSQA